MSRELDTKLVKLSENPGLIEEIRDYFKENIEPIYGDQTVALNKVVSANDRRCDAILIGGAIAGVAICKNAPSGEYSQFGLENAMELKTFYISVESNKSRGLLAIELMKQVARNAIGCGATSIFGLISLSKKASINFFHRIGFVDVATVKKTNCLTEEVIVTSGDLADFSKKLNSQRSYSRKLTTERAVDKSSNISRIM